MVEPGSTEPIATNIAVLLIGNIILVLVKAIGSTEPIATNIAVLLIGNIILVLVKAIGTGGSNRKTQKVNFAA